PPRQRQQGRLLWSTCASSLSQIVPARIISRYRSIGFPTGPRAPGMAGALKRRCAAEPLGGSGGLRLALVVAVALDQFLDLVGRALQQMLQRSLLLFRISQLMLELARILIIFGHISTFTLSPSQEE